MSISSRETKKGRVYDVRLRGPDGTAYKRTFKTKKEATDFEAAEVIKRNRGEWIDPSAGRVTFGEYSDEWMSHRPDLRPRTSELYRWLLGKHISPFLSAIPLAKLQPTDIRAWHAGLIDSGLGSVTVAKAYRLTRAILQTAVDDGVIARNPCVIRGAGVERSAERPTASIEQVDRLAAAVDERYSMLVLLAAFCGLRLGELLALRRGRIDLQRGLLRVEETQHELADRSTIVGPPKTDAGRRVVAIPPHLIVPLEQHLSRFVAAGDDALVFAGAKGGWLRRSLWNAKWRKARAEVGLPNLRFHDLRHTGNTLAAEI